MKKRVDPNHRVEDCWILATIEDITTPKSGRICLGPVWWKVTDADEVIFYKDYSSPICNQNKSIVENIGCGFPYPTKLFFLKMVFIPHRCEDYV